MVKGPCSASGGVGMVRAGNRTNPTGGPLMPATTTKEETTTNRLISTLEDAEHASLEAVRKFVDTVDSAFPDLGEDGPRRKIIDSAFKMTEQLVSASNRLAQNFLEVTEKALSDGDGKTTKK
jgi:hypothetical protein